MEKSPLKWVAKSLRIFETLLCFLFKNLIILIFHDHMGHEIVSGKINDF